MAKKNLIFLTIIIIIIGAAIVAGGFVLKPTREVIVEDSVLSQIKARGKIIIGTEATYPPMESIDERGNFIGMDIDIAKEIVSDLGVKTEFQNIIWEELFDALLRGEVDMLISSITITAERTERMAFSDPYFNAGQVIVTSLDKAGQIQGVEDLAGKKLGVQIETTSEIEAQKYTDLELVISFENYDLAKEALLSGEIDVIIIDYPAGVGMVSGETTLKIIGEPFTQEFYGIAVQKEATVLLKKINESLRRLKRENKLGELEMKWLSR